MSDDADATEPVSLALALIVAFNDLFVDPHNPTMVRFVESTVETAVDEVGLLPLVSAMGGFAALFLRGLSDSAGVPAQKILEDLSMSATLLRDFPTGPPQG